MRFWTHSTHSPNRNIYNRIRIDGVSDMFTDLRSSQQTPVRPHILLFVCQGNVSYCVCNRWFLGHHRIRIRQLTFCHFICSADAITVFTHAFFSFALTQIVHENLLRPKLVSILLFFCLLLHALQTSTFCSIYTHRTE